MLACCPPNTASLTAPTATSTCAVAKSYSTESTLAVAETRTRKPNCLGKRAAEIRADDDAWRDEGRVVESCLFCPWTYAGTAGEGRAMARAHREARHPEAVGRRTYRKPPRSYQIRAPGDQVIEDQRRARLEREEAERLATIARGRARAAAT